MENTVNKKYPKISIITVCFNSAKTIEQTILSVINQTYSNIEYIIIDGKSTDGTVDIIKKYQDKIAYWVSEPDGGIYDAMNKGIEKATGDYIYFINSGDYVAVDIFNQIEATLCQGYDFIYGRVYMRNTNKLYGKNFNKYSISFQNICHQAILYKRNVLVEMGYFDTNYPILADWVFNIKCFGNKEIRKDYIEAVFADYEGGGVSETSHDINFDKNRLKNLYQELGIMVFFIFIVRTVISCLLSKLGIKDKIKMFLYKEKDVLVT